MVKYGEIICNFPSHATHFKSVFFCTLEFNRVNGIVKSNLFSFCSCEYAKRTFLFTVYIQFMQNFFHRKCRWMFLECIERIDPFAIAAFLRVDKGKQNASNVKVPQQQFFVVIMGKYYTFEHEHTANKVSLKLFSSNYTYRV